MSYINEVDLRDTHDNVVDNATGGDQVNQPGEDSGRSVAQLQE